jgi:hypothetical protein
MMIRRVALLSMLLCAFVLMMRTRRAREAESAATVSSHVAAASSSARDASPALAQTAHTTGQTAPVAQPAEAPSPPTTAPVLPDSAVAAAAGSHKSSSVTLARRAADAVANGAYADALPMYEELGAEGGPNAPAYQQTARILRSRLEQNGVAPR